jgi:hypothetical protein
MCKCCIWSVSSQNAINATAKIQLFEFLVPQIISDDTSLLKKIWKITSSRRQKSWKYHLQCFWRLFKTIYAYLRHLESYYSNWKVSWRINFNNICEIIQTSDEFSRHLETYYGLIRWLKRLRRVDLFFIFFFNPFFPQKNPEFRINPEESHLCRINHKCSAGTVQLSRALRPIDLSVKH